MDWKILQFNRFKQDFSLSNRRTEKSCPLFILFHYLFSYQEKGCECPLLVGEGSLNYKGGEVE